ncbi:MAG: DUF362 domain-containing protein [Dehalococcoidia bacterium]|nr:MAG: DUF362 domain-containing protein [Dehalococcoidia bacterium]
MSKSKVALVRCDSYDEAEVYGAVSRGLDLIGGIACFVRKGEKIVLKPNVLLGAGPEKCVTTHPAVFKAVGRILKDAGVDVLCGDSPGFMIRIGPAMQKTGLQKAASELDILLADFEEGKTVTHKAALLSSRFVIANGVLDSDGLVSLPKLKTHGLTRMTGAIKNQFGCIPGLLKAQYHVKMPDPFNFAAMLVDLTAFIRPRLYVMDAVVAMEGNGPSGGTPRRVNAILLSGDPIALDSIACKIINLDPEIVPTSKPGEKAGLGTYHYSDIEVVGDDINAFIVSDFDVVRKSPVSVSGGHIRTFIKNQTCPGPGIDKTKCTRCGICWKVCPLDPKAITWHRETGQFPQHNYGKCIRCYCCQEMCPEGAISIKNTFLGKAIFGRV